MLAQKQLARRFDETAEPPRSGHLNYRLDKEKMELRAAEIELVIIGARSELNDRAEKRLVQLLNERLNWDEVISIASAHGVVPLLFRNLAPYNKNIPTRVLERLRLFTIQNNLNNLYLAGELSKLLRTMDESGITALPYKGPILATTVYGDLSLRQFSDLDILISKQDLPKAKKLFHEIGYTPSMERTETQEEAYLNAGQPYNYKFASANGRSRVELHWQFTSKYNSFILDYQQLRTRLVRIDFGGRQVCNLNPEDLLLVLSQHGSKHFWQRLLWLCDIAELLKKYKELDWVEVVSRAESMGIRRMLFLGLHLTERLFESELPQAIAAKIRSDRSVKKLADRIEEQLFHRNSRLIKHFERHKFSCEMRERVRDKVRYAGYRIFAPLGKATKPTERDRKALPLVLQSSSIVYVFRPIRLLVERIRNVLIKTKSLGIALLLIPTLIVAMACTKSKKISRRNYLASDYNVEYRHGAKILTIVVGRNGVHYSLSKNKVNSSVLIDREVQNGHVLEIGISGSCKLVGPPPQKLVLDLTHEVTNASVWHFPSPIQSTDLAFPNTSFDTVILADGEPIPLPRHYQGEFKKVAGSDAASYESIVTELSLDNFVRMANSRAVTIQFASAASFDLDEETLSALKDFAAILNAGEAVASNVVVNESQAVHE